MDGLYLTESRIKMDDFGVPLFFLETPMLMACPTERNPFSPRNSRGPDDDQVLLKTVGFP